MLSDKFYAVKAYIQNNKSDLFIAVSFLLISLIGFGFGRLSYIIQEKPEIKIENVRLGDLTDPRTNSAAIYVASKNGSAYYPSACPGASRIKEENKVWFSSSKEAEGRGYKPAKNC
ncbi:MAG: hypothetical protein HYW09_01725 [Candidatus Niyogibacteria bacterium]|nr:hypothetical protein [Candidatus Niyogibacteria bacterium]